MNTYYKNCPPYTSLIQGMIDATSMTLKISIQEYIANSLDQDSTRIDLKLDRTRGELIIEDDGNGCEDLERMVGIGSHVPSKRGAGVGRFGVGFKDASIWLATKVTIESCTRNLKRETAFADWLDMMARGPYDWDIKFGDDSTKRSHGVRVILTGLYLNRVKTWDRVATYVAELFSAALDTGIKITVDGVSVKSTPQPLLTDSVQFNGEVNGLKFEGICGILQDRKAAASGWEIRYLHQTIDSGYLKEGFGSYSPQGFYGRFYMVDGEKHRWNLNRNKTDSEDLAMGLNCKDMQDIMRPILEKLKARQESVAIRLNRISVNSVLTSLLETIQVRLSEDEVEPGRKRGGKRPGPGPGERIRPWIDPNTANTTRKKGIEDSESQLKAKIRRAQEIIVSPFEKNRDRGGLGWVQLSNHDTTITIYVENTTKVGKGIWSDDIRLMDHAIRTLGEYFGTKLDIATQLRLPVGDLGVSEDEKIARVCLYLFEHADLSILEEKKRAA